MGRLIETALLALFGFTLAAAFVAVAVRIAAQRQQRSPG